MYTLLIIDDEPLIRRGICSLVDFQSLKIDQVYEAANGLEGLELFRSHSPDLVLADINMPKMNGLDFAKEAKRLKPEVKIALITGYNYFDYALSALKLGVDDYVLKPVSKKDVTEVLIKLVALADASLQQKALENMVSSILLKTPAQEDNDFKTLLQQKVAEHLSDYEFSLAVLASELGFSASYLSGLIKKSLGVNFQDYVLALRLERAKLLLLTTEMKNYEIAEAIGIEDVNYFGTRFKLKYGISPKQYKEQVKGGVR